MKPKTEAPERVLFIEFTTSEHYEGLKPFAFVTSDDCRYDVEYDSRDGALVYDCCGANQCYPVCYLEGCEHQYWAAENITVVTNSGEPAPPENRVALPVEYQGRFDEWPDMVDGQDE